MFIENKKEFLFKKIVAPVLFWGVIFFVAFIFPSLFDNKNGQKEYSITFDKSALVCLGDSGGRISSKQCYLPVNCYQSGGRLETITCQDEILPVQKIENYQSDPYRFAP